MTLLLVGVGAIAAGGVAAALPWSKRSAGDALFQALVAIGCALGAAGALRVLVSGVPVEARMHASVPGGDWLIGIDALSAVFLVAVFGVGGLCAIFGSHDLSRERTEHHDAARLANPAFAVLVAAIAVVVVARSVIVFLGAWEVMSISSYVLIVTHHEDAGIRRSGLIYLVATHTATLALFAMFATWQAHATDWSFAALAAAAPSLETGAARAVLLLALVGFGFKAGLVPMHFWLPPAHAAAPSHVSALMSGIVIKTGIYGLLRVIMLLGGAPAWWAWLVLGLGVASGVLGVLWALAQHDMKRLLAYHSVENIGIILMGIGIGALGVAHHAPAIAMLGFAGGLLHSVNHALFKSLLFLGAGAVYRATGTRNMEELGGLARRMPWTWLSFVVGAAAIIGVPPFNGFVSEWLVYQGLFLTGESGGSLRLALVGIPALALIGALALACFAKVAGVVFLGASRTTKTANATDPGGGGRAPMALLAVACITLGMVPLIGISLVRAAAGELSGTDTTAFPETVLSGARAISLLTATTLALAVVMWGIRRALERRHVVRRDITWGCGYAGPTPRMQYTASSFAAPLLGIFGRVSAIRVERSAASLHTYPFDLVLDGVALPLWRAIQRGGLRLRGLQRGRIQLYVLNVMAALILVLAYLVLAGGFRG